MTTTSIHVTHGDTKIDVVNFPNDGFTTVDLTDNDEGGAVEIFLRDPADADALIAAAGVARAYLVAHQEAKRQDALSQAAADGALDVELNDVDQRVREGESTHVGDTGYAYSDHSPEAMTATQENLK